MAVSMGYAGSHVAGEAVETYPGLQAEGDRDTDSAWHGLLMHQSQPPGMHILQGYTY